MPCARIDYRGAIFLLKRSIVTSSIAAPTRSARRSLAKAPGFRLCAPPFRCPLVSRSTSRVRCGRATVACPSFLASLRNSFLALHLRSSARILLCFRRVEIAERFEKICPEFAIAFQREDDELAPFNDVFRLQFIERIDRRRIVENAEDCPFQIFTPGSSELFFLITVRIFRE